jgi:hypothetical protein
MELVAKHQDDKTRKQMSQQQEKQVNIESPNHQYIHT